MNESRSVVIKTPKVFPVLESFLLLQDTVEGCHCPGLSCWGLETQEERGQPSVAETNSALFLLTIHVRPVHLGRLQLCFEL